MLAVRIEQSRELLARLLKRSDRSVPYHTICAASYNSRREALSRRPEDRTFEADYSTNLGYLHSSNLLDTHL